MSTITSSGRASLAVLGSILILAVILLWLAPAEETLGNGITSVYIHVALTWTGMTGLLLAGLLGLLMAIFSRPALGSWIYSLVWIALAMFAGGLIMSIIAARVNWGAIFWQEPRTNSAFQLLAIGLIVQLLNSWRLPYRIKGLLYVIPAAYLAWSIRVTPLILHPQNAARSSPSSAIQLVFFGLFGLSVLAGAWLVVALRRRLSP
jgi:hypothetical protein